MIKNNLRKMIRVMADWPLFGRFVRVVVALIHLPELRAAHFELNHRQHVLEVEKLPTLLREFSKLTSDFLELNHRQYVLDTEKQNFIKSVPLGLRKITRDLIGIHRQLEVVENFFDQRLNEARGQLGDVANSVDQRLNDACGQLDDVKNSASYLMGRVEFVRRELMFEMRYGASIISNDTVQIKAKTEILNAEKLAVARHEGVLLNLGCGHVPIDGYLNVDRRALPGVDIVAEVDVLPFDRSEVDEIFSAHLLEHFPQEQLRRELLPYWIGLLKHGGVLRSVVPDAESMIKGYVGGSYPYASLREVTFGAQDYDGDFHYNMFAAEQIEELLKEAGLVEIEWLAKGRKNGACFEMEFRAVKK
jgi:SAM-dependent methyltransferase